MDTKTSGQQQQHPKYYSAEQVAKVLTWNLVNSAVEEALRATGPTEANPQDADASFAIQPARTLTSCGDRSKILFTMPGFVGNYKLNDKRTNTLACKLVTSFSSNQKLTPPLPNILANILIFNSETGQLQCIMDGTQITGWRTASASLAATKYLYLHRYPEGTNKAIRVAIIGCGVQGQSHAMGMCKTFNVIDIYLWNRTKSKADQLGEKLRAEFPNALRVHICEKPEEACREADVICVGTYSPTALINYSMLKRDNVHINTVGAGQVHFGEVAQDIYDNGVVYVDSLVSAQTELKGLKANIVGEIGDVIRNKGQRQEQNRITIFQSMGIAAEDATVAQAVYEELNK
ncbi:ketimine reductase mu-crystallin [Musca vetustissima]|uniref:ketimine reductase mu-crystallin n=1 Tax=Musca vetustissima TaxID=27455 RepID=UPI002AB68987|nr:ketimine reductase mu-crystallin [Musca vetustissima]